MVSISLTDMEQEHAADDYTETFKRVEWLKDSTYNSARCVLLYSIPFMFAMLHAFILMVAVAERPQRFNYGMTSKTPSDCTDSWEPKECKSYSKRCEWKKGQCVSLCKSLSATECTKRAGCDWSDSCNEYLPCRQSISGEIPRSISGELRRSQSTDNLKDSTKKAKQGRRQRRHSLDLGYFEQKEEDDSMFKYEASRQNLQKCFLKLGFVGFEEGRNFVVDAKCKTDRVLKSNIKVVNPIDCIDGQHVVALQVALDPSDDPHIFECRTYEAAKNGIDFAKKCLTPKGRIPKGEKEKELSYTSQNWNWGGQDMTYQTLWVRFG